MSEENKASVQYSIKLPSDLDYIPPLRQCISELALGEGFSKKFCFRTEILVDELCTNAVIHGNKNVQDQISIEAQFYEDMLELQVCNKGGTGESLAALKNAVDNPQAFFHQKKGRGIAIAKLLCSDLKIDITKDGFTQLVVIKKDELNGEDDEEIGFLLGRRP